MFYLSSWFEERRDQYILLLRDLGQSEGAWNRWVGFFLTGLAEQANQNASTVLAIKELYEDLKGRVIQHTHSPYAVLLPDQIFEHPIFSSSDLKFPSPPPSRALVAGLLRTLRDANVVAVLREGSGRRPTVYVQGALMNLCEGRDVFKTY